MKLVEQFWGIEFCTYTMIFIVDYILRPVQTCSGVLVFIDDYHSLFSKGKYSVHILNAIYIHYVLWSSPVHSVYYYYNFFW